MLMEGGLFELKRFLSVQGVILVMVLMVMTLGSGTVFAGGQASVQPQESIKRMDGAELVTSQICVANEQTMAAYMSGFGAGEMVLLSIVRDGIDFRIWYSGQVNVAGALALEYVMKDIKKPGGTQDGYFIVKYPTAGLYTLEAYGSSGRLATAPIIIADAKCDGEVSYADVHAAGYY